MEKKKKAQWKNGRWKILQDALLAHPYSTSGYLAYVSGLGLHAVRMLLRSALEDGIVKKQTRWIAGGNNGYTWEYYLSPRRTP